MIQNWLIGIFWGIVAQISTFYQLQGPLKYPWMRENVWVLWLCGIPISYFYMTSVKNLVIAFNGEIWPSRMIGFVIGVFVFSVLSITLFGEPMKPKTIVCLLLAGLILAIQLLWK